ncbi:MAG: hypothetical protein KAJ09_02170 [Deltaproteobacteria bacterium]|nr:hypothetical protein [Deltaproteobacteria bacterium]
MAIPRDVKTYSRKLDVGEMVRMLPKPSMNNMSKMEYHGIAARTKTEKYEGGFTKAVDF